MNETLRPVVLSTCAWGDWHVRMLMQIAWPTALARRNLAALARICKVNYRICTSNRDREVMERSAVFRAIADLVPVEFLPTPSENPDPIFHMDWYFGSLEYARSVGAVHMTLWPDVVFTDRSFEYAAEAVRANFAGAIIPTYRVISETCVAELDARPQSEGTDVMSLEPSEVVRLAIKHMHPLSAAAMNGGAVARPEFAMFFRVPGEGLVSRGVSTWMFVDPSRIKISHSNNGEATLESDCPCDEIYIARSTDEMLFLSLAPLRKELEVYIPRRQIQPGDLARMTLHPFLRNSPFFDCFDQVRTDMPYRSIAGPAWGKVAALSEKKMRQVRTIRQLTRVWMALRDRGIKHAAGVLAAAVQGARLAQHWSNDGPVTAFIPVDAALDISGGSLRRRLEWRERRRLVAFILDQVVPGSPDLTQSGSGDLTSLGGRTIEVQRSSSGTILNNRAKIVDGVVNPSAGEH